MSLFAGVRRVLLVHAHPDDESLDTAGLMAHLVRRGTAVSLVTATRGERGEVVPGPLKPLEGTPALAERRLAELAASLAVVGVTDHRLLGAAGARADGRPPRRYSDSGMAWGPDGRAVAVPDSSADAFSLAPLDEATADLLAVVDELRPEVVVSYDVGGGYGHPDHVRAATLARAAAAARGIRLVEIVKPDAVRDGDEEMPLDDGMLHVKRRALAAHASQLTVTADDLVMSGGQHVELPRSEWYRPAGGSGWNADGNPTASLR